MNFFQVDDRHICDLFNPDDVNIIPEIPENNLLENLENQEKDVPLNHLLHTSEAGVCISVRN